MSETTADRHRHRTINPEVVANRGALDVVRPINRQVGVWQSAVVRLSMLAGRDDQGGCLGTLISEAEALLAEVDAERERLDEARSGLSAAVAGNSRILDTTRSLERLSATISGVLSRMHPAARA